MSMECLGCLGWAMYGKFGLCQWFMGECLEGAEVYSHLLSCS